MNIFKWLYRNNSSEPKQKFEDTEEGKEFIEKYKSSLEKRKLLNEEWERTTPPEKKAQVKLFKIIFPIFFFIYFAFLFWGFNTNKELYVLGVEFCISFVSLIFFFIKPKFVKYPNCFMMPVIAFGSMILFYVYLGLDYGFNFKAIGKETVDIYSEKEEDFIEKTLKEKPELSMSDFENLEYSKFLLDNNIETKWELKNDYLNHYSDNREPLEKKQ